MFEVEIENVIRLGNNISFGGLCKNKQKWTPELIDSDRNVYKTYIPLGKDLVLDESQITLAMSGDFTPETLKGKILYAVT